MPDKQSDSYGVEKLEQIDESLGAQGRMYEQRVEEYGLLKGSYIHYKKLILGG